MAKTDNDLFDEWYYTGDKCDHRFMDDSRNLYYKTLEAFKQGLKTHEDKLIEKDNIIKELEEKLYGKKQECGCYTTPGGTTYLCARCDDLYSPF